MKCGSPRRWQASRAASTALGEQHARSESGPCGSIQRRRVTPTAPGPARSSATALSTPPLIATAVRPGAGAARTAAASAFARASTARVSPPTAAASSSVRPRRSSANPSAAASTIRPRSTCRRTYAQSAPRAESPTSSRTSRPGYWAGNGRREPWLPPSCSDTAGLPRPCEPGQARWVPCGRRSFAAPGPTRAPCHMVLVLHGCAASRTASGNRTTVPMVSYLARRTPSGRSARRAARAAARAHR